MNHEDELINIPIRLQDSKYEGNEIIIKDEVRIDIGIKILGNIMIGYGAVFVANSTHRPSKSCCCSRKSS